MLDVVHVMFEEDLVPQFESQLEARSSVRTQIYSQLYGQDYKYKIKAQGSTQQEALGLDPDLTLPEEMLETKPYIPPTDPDDLPGILDAPLG